eukprot:TRINITY_DN10575_c0_g1_i1.p1 TRINITY_DN10575_c0_g1~~TRINITY_DN10575_c0_g1_i1.p1  ORF type:complete len:109 (-),score=3.29 TRINITY_DN10575_c0_g1_i1:212-490(-)
MGSELITQGTAGQATDHTSGELMCWKPTYSPIVTDPQKAASVQAMLADFLLKIADIFSEKNVSLYLGASHQNCYEFGCYKRTYGMKKCRKGA